MRFSPRHLALTLLALALIGCEREEISYPSPQKPPGEQDDTTATTPTPPGNPYDEPHNPGDSTAWIASTLCGDWHGPLQSRYVDDYGRFHEEHSVARFTFKPYHENAANGYGSETDSVNGKEVFFMSYHWYVSDDKHIHLRYDDKIERHIIKYSLNSHSFIGDMTTGDGLEECHFTLSR